MQRKKILVLAEYIGENHNSTAYYWSKIVKRLSTNYTVILVVPNTVHAREFANKYGVQARYVEYILHNKNSLTSRLLGQIRQTIRFLRVVRSESKGADIVFSGTNPIVTMFAMAVLRKVLKFKWLVLVHDVFPNNLVPAGVLGGSSTPYRILTYFSKKVYSMPDRMICIGRDMKKLLDHKTGKPKKIQFIPNWASTSVISCEPKASNEVLSALGWNKDTVVFQFFGNMGRLQGIANLMEAITLTKNKESRFLFIGGGSESEHVKQIVSKVNKSFSYERAHYYGQLELEKNTIGLNACDVALVTLSKDMYGLGVPSKAYFSMAANKPIVYVGDSGSELDVLLSEHELGWFCPCDQPETLAKLLDNIADDYVNGTNIHLQPRKILESKFSEKMALDAITSQVGDMVD